MHDNDRDNGDFRIIGGGPVYRLFTRLGIGEAEGYSVWRAALLFTLIAWVPLFLLALVQQFALGIVPRFSLFGDMLVYARLFIVVCILLAAVGYVSPSTTMVVREFRRSGIIQPADDKKFAAVLADARRLGNSALAETILIIASYIGAFVGLRMEWHDQVSTWLAIVSHGHEQLTPAGWWYLVITVPLFQLLLYRWLWRLFIWYRVLWGVSRLPMQLMPTHPDLMGGLGFLIIGHAGFAFIIFTASVLISASVGNRYLLHHIHPPTYLTLFASIITVLLIVFILPLFMFTPQLIRAKRQGLLDYTYMASIYVRAFTEKWENGRNVPPEDMLGNPDYQSLADMTNGFNNVRRMRVIPFTFNLFLFFLLMAFIPIIPLLFTVRTAREIIDIFFKLILP